MIIVPVKEGESIDRALKRYKRKYEKTGVVKELRNRQKFTKPSIIKREQRMCRISFFGLYILNKPFYHLKHFMGQR